MGMAAVQEAQQHLRSTAGKLTEIREGLRTVQTGLPVPLEEVTAEDSRQDKDPHPAAEIRAVIDCGIHDCLEPLIRDLLAAADYKPANGRRGDSARLGTVVRLDLTRNDEATRKLLYQLVVRDNFLVRPLADPGDVWVPSYTPEEAGLEVYFENGRWFATWWKLEEPADRPESDRRELLLLEEDEKRPGNLCYREV